MILAGYKNIEGIIEVVTGLHIGGSTAVIEIGGKGNPVIKHPGTREPYIPGSSLKGKMRSLLEWKSGTFVRKDSTGKISGEPCSCGEENCAICIVFGTSADKSSLGPPRLVVRDAVIDPDFKKDMLNRDPSWTVFELTESKTENAINRITARANPRYMERVISGVRFTFSMSYRVFQNTDGATVQSGEESKDDDKYFHHVLDGLRLIERDALGGAGSRGCGQVRFHVRVGDELKPVRDVKPEDFPTEMIGCGDDTPK